MEGVCTRQAAVLGGHLPARQDDLSAEVGQVGDNEDIRVATGGDLADLAADAEVLGGVDRRHLDRGHRRHAPADGMAHGAVHVAFADQRGRVRVVGAEQEVARVEAHLGDGANLFGDIVPGRAEAQHGAHALAHTRDSVFQARAFVVVHRAAGHVPGEFGGQVRRGIMPADDLGGAARGFHLGVHHLVAGGHARVIHHLAQADHARPLQRFANFVRGQLGAVGLQPGGRGHAGGDLDEDMDGLQGGFIDH